MEIVFFIVGYSLRKDFAPTSKFFPKRDWEAEWELILSLKRPGVNSFLKETRSKLFP